MRRSNRQYFFVFDDAENFGLQAEWQFTDLVKKNRPTLSALEESLLRARGTGKRSFHVPKQLAFKKRFGYRAAVDRQKHHIRLRTLQVNRSGDDFLAYPAVAGDQYIAARRRDFWNHP